MIERAGYYVTNQYGEIVASGIGSYDAAMQYAQRYTNGIYLIEWSD